MTLFQPSFIQFLHDLMCHFLCILFVRYMRNHSKVLMVRFYKNLNKQKNNGMFVFFNLMKSNFHGCLQVSNDSLVKQEESIDWVYFYCN